MNLRTLIRSLLFLVMFAPTCHLSGQGEITEGERIFYRNERSFSGNLYSNGWSANFRYAFRKDASRAFLAEADLASIRHPKEFKSQSPYVLGWGRTYVFGKLNEVFMLRAGGGYQKELFRKFDQGGISLRYFANAGLTLGFLKPIYYWKVVGFNPVSYTVITDESLFDPDFMQSIYDIYDKQSFFKGLDEIKLNPGIFARFGLTFEYSQEDQLLRALEGGIQIEAFGRELPIMASTKNSQIFFSLFAGYRFGRVLDARYKNTVL